MERNVNLAKLKAGYLFPEIARRKRELLEQQPDAKIISLGIGNTTEPLSPTIAQGLIKGAEAFAHPESYSGYSDDSKGEQALRESIANTLYNSEVTAEDIYVSDGSKCDIGRLQVLFGEGTRIAVQDPSYPVYVDGGVILGHTGACDEETGQFANVHYMPCTPENNFFPELPSEPVDVIYFCSPNNPTGATATRKQLETLVEYARKNGSIIVYDAAYAFFIKDPAIPKSIFEIPGARHCAIETNSFSKCAGFTGIRLGWTVVPQELQYADGSSVASDWTRVVNTIFNGASKIVQAGGLAALSPEGLKEMRATTDLYMANAQVIKQALQSIGMELYGGDNCPYIWARLKGKDSWSAFSTLLEEAHVVTTPGSGFGPGGEGFLRFSAFGHPQSVEEAAGRLIKALA